MKRVLFAAALAALILSPAAAQDAASEFDSLASIDSSADPSAEAPNLGTLKWSGVQDLAWRWGAALHPTRTGGSIDSSLSAEYKLGDLKVLGAAQVRDNEFLPGETLIQWAPGAFKLSAGLSEFSWGVADGSNPTDTLNARDYRYGANAARLVNPAVSLAWYPVDFVSLEAVYEPWKEASKFPKDFKASTQAGLDAGKAAFVAAGLGAFFSGYNPTTTAETTVRDTKHPVFGGRANFFLPGLDLSLSYLSDRDTYFSPEVTMQGVNLALAGQGTYWLPSKVDLVLKTVQRFGVNAKTTVDRFGFWLEAAYNLTEDSAGTDDGIRNDKVTWTTGTDFSFGPSGTYYANLQYAGDLVLGYDSATLKDYVASPTKAQLNDKAYMLKRTLRSMTQSIGAESEASLHGLTYSLKFPLAGDLLTPTFSGAIMVPLGYDDTAKTRVASALFKPELDLMPADGVHVLLGADLAYGWVKEAGSSDIVLDTTTDKLGVYTPQNNVYLKVQYKWNGGL